MRIPRLLPLLTAVLLPLGLTSVIAAPAQAATAPIVRFWLDADNGGQVARDTGVRGDYHAMFDGEVMYRNSSGAIAHLPNYGYTVRLQRRWAGSRTWRTIDSTQNTYQYFFDADSKFRYNASYRVYFTGGTGTGGTSTIDFAPGYSRVVTLGVHRKVAAHDANPINTNRHHIKGHVSPKWAHHKVTIQVKKCKHCHWKRFRKVRLNTHSKFKVKVRPTKHMLRYRVVAKGTTRFLRTHSQTMRIKRYNYSCPKILCG